MNEDRTSEMPTNDHGRGTRLHIIEVNLLNICFSRLIPKVAENAAARALSEAKPLAWRSPRPKACRGAKPRGREGGDSRGKRVGECIPDCIHPIIRTGVTLCSFCSYI